MHGRSAGVVIIGGGIMGLSIAHALAKRGMRDVLVLEKNALGSGASGKSGALIRMHYTNRWDATLAHASFPHYRHWDEEIAGPVVFHRTGFLMVVSEENADRLRANVSMLQDVGINTRVVDAYEMSQLEPNASTEGVGAAAYEPDSGYVDGIAAMQSLGKLIRMQGLTIAEGVSATSIETSAGRVTAVNTQLGQVACEHVVVAGGGWSPALLYPLGIESHVRTKRILTHFVGWPDDFEGGHMTYLDNVAGTYFRPDAGRFSIVGAHSMEWGVDPDTLSTNVENDAMEKARERLASRIPALAKGRPSGGRSAMDGFSDDMHAIIDSNVGWDGLHVAMGFSGAGFKIAPAVGEAIAESILFGRSQSTDISAFRLSRFDDGDPIKGDHEYPVMAGTGTRLA